MRKVDHKSIVRILKPYGVPADEDLCEQIRIYVQVLLAWNRKISLTTVTDPVEILKFHFGESFFASAVGQMHDGRLADVGSGAGFPGIPLRMLNPGLSLTLIESDVRKCAFMSEVVRKIGLDRVAVVHSRIEDVPASAGPFDFITARAIGKHVELLSWAKPRLARAGKIVLWLGWDDAKSISGDPNWLWQTPARIPGSRRRYVLVGSPSG